MNSNLSNTIDLLMNKANGCLNESQDILNTLLQSLLAEDESDDGNDGDDSEGICTSADEDAAFKIQLILQYRLGCEEALCILFRLDQNLFFSLGMQPAQSYKTNIDRLAYAVGKEDFKQILNILALLTGYLSKIAARYKSTHASFSSKDKRQQNHHTLGSQELPMLIEKQQQFQEELNKLEPQIEAIIKQQTEEQLMVEYFEAIRTGIITYYNVLTEALKKSEQLYHYLNKKAVVDKQLHRVLKEAEHVLHLMPSIFNPHSHYPIKQFDHPSASEKLEQRATAKRLRPFFG